MSQGWPWACKKKLLGLALSLGKKCHNFSLGDRKWKGCIILALTIGKGNY